MFYIAYEVYNSKLKNRIHIESNNTPILQILKLADMIR